MNEDDMLRVFFPRLLMERMLKTEMNTIQYDSILKFIKGVTNHTIENTISLMDSKNKNKYVSIPIEDPWCDEDDTL